MRDDCAAETNNWHRACTTHAWTDVVGEPEWAVLGPVAARVACSGETAYGRAGQSLMCVRMNAVVEMPRGVGSSKRRDRNECKESGRSSGCSVRARVHVSGTGAEVSFRLRRQWWRCVGFVFD